ncbi:MAG: hypothetical protein ACYCOU_00075 [Sulfobacillus sp.]
MTPGAKPTPIDWARLAAYIDGEGCIACKIRAGGHRCSAMLVCVSNTDLRLLNWLQDTFGGKVRYAVGNKETGRRKIWRWEVFNDQAESILEGCMEFFIMKKEQAEIAIGYRQLIRRQKSSMGYGPGKKLPEHFLKEREQVLNAMSRARYSGSEMMVN